MGTMINQPATDISPVCDKKRHLICTPYSIDNLHFMARTLGIGRCWYHGGKFPHYDIPIRRVEEISKKCEVISTKELLQIIIENK
jgi:hypothetical protein